MCKGFRPQTWVFEWNAQDSLLWRMARWRNGYDPFGRRIFKESGGRREVFLWDGDVLARSDDIDWFHEPDSFRPMARRQAGALFHIVNDHLGTPREMFSEGGALAWSVDHDTWGTLRHVDSRPVERGDYWVETVAYEVSEVRPESAALLCPIRFQGQWEDAESGLYYNRFRYYEPLAGQYVSPDPIGIAGGERSLGYVVTPATFVDPIGLSGCCLCNVGDVGEVLASELNRGHEIGGSASSKRVLSIADNMRANGFDRNNPILAVVHGGKLYVVDGHHRLAAAKISGVNPYVQIVDPQDWIGQGKYGSMEDITGVKPPNNIRDKGKRVPC